jgi:3-isopropylmalate/(R)-2-methylmalate dehydratase large subunit
MGMTISEKILANVSANEFVEPGELIDARVDLVTMVEVTFVTSSNVNVQMQLQEIEAEEIVDPERITIFYDHLVPITDSSVAELKETIDSFAEQWGIPKENIIEPGDHGISHISAVEKGFALPGTFAASQDAHAPTMGGIGCFSVAAGFNLLSDFVTGTNRIEVPETIHVRIDGEFPVGVTERDLMQQLNGALGPGEAKFKVLEFSGPTVEDMTIQNRMTLCNRSVAIGATTGIVNPDEKTIEYVENATDRSFTPLSTDADAEYERELQYDVSALEPMVARPGSPLDTTVTSDVAGVPIDQAFVGSCAGGYQKDLRLAAEILRNNEVADGVKMVIAPGTMEIYREAAREHLVETFIESGAIVSESACGPCYGATYALSEGQVCIATGTTNTPGRMGDPEAEIYLGNPATVAASAIEGVITDPRNFLEV